MGSTRRVVAAMAFATGAGGGQPLLRPAAGEPRSRARSTPRPARVGLVITLIQISYAIGLATLVPLGDLLERRNCWSHCS